MLTSKSDVEFFVVFFFCIGISIYSAFFVTAFLRLSLLIWCRVLNSIEILFSATWYIESGAMSLEVRFRIAGEKFIYRDE